MRVQANAAPESVGRVALRAHRPRTRRAGEAHLELTQQLRSQTLYVRPTAGVYIVVAAHSSAVITVPDVASGRSVLHVIDSVLIPSTVDVEL